ncbi:hypothetical protein IWW55_000039 [Coemansia sp. RSA 2706]|nr:hypothetical protein IWW55_000039 [Coemansia sp. RSA 2706]KAJ2383249.1 hypothetical protein H4S02_005388 [Coemansia sp. RSA 2611]
MSRTPFLEPLYNQQTRWNCMPCTDSSGCFGSYENFLRPTDSQAMGQALALADEYVRIAEQYPMLTFNKNSALFLEPGLFTSPLNLANSHSSTIRHSTSSGNLALSLDFIEKSRPIRSTRTRPPTASSCDAKSDTVCESVVHDSQYIYTKEPANMRPSKSSKIKHSLRRHSRRIRSLFA